MFYFVRRPKRALEGSWSSFFVLFCFSFGSFAELSYNTHQMKSAVSVCFLLVLMYVALPVGVGKRGLFLKWWIYVSLCVVVASSLALLFSSLCARCGAVVLLSVLAWLFAGPGACS